MNRLLLIICSVLVLSQNLLAQETDTSYVTKTKEFRAFGNTWVYQKYDDGTSTFEMEEDYEEDTFKVSKSSKFGTGLATDIGINVWTPADNAPAIKPWGSWNVGLNWLGVYKASTNFHLKTGLGVSWYNFKFEDRSLIAVKTADGLAFDEFTEGTGTKSKISASYANVSFIPTIRSNDGKLRLGIGGYAGLRIGGRGKFVYDDSDGQKQKIYEKSNMFVNNFRYGGRIEIGVGETNLFFNYDLNDLFESGNGPQVNAISFGLIFI